MCVICVSAAGVPQPAARQLAAMFQNNPHGAGYMVARNGKVEIHKGFMCLPDYLRQIEAEHFTPDDAVVYHCRISTQAGVTPQMTHPFPLTSRLNVCRALDVTCAIGIAHNGVIPMTTDPTDREYNDTARFITRYMTRLIRSAKDLHDPAILEILSRLTTSKWALMDGTGYIATVGNYISARNGLLFSNNTYTGECKTCKPSSPSFWSYSSFDPCLVDRL